MSFDILKNEIIDQDLCTSCGICVAVCPKGLLSITSDSPVPTIRDGMLDACGDCTLCIDVCPGRLTSVPESEERIHGRSRDKDERWSGISRGTYSAKAIDPATRAAASAGGAATALLITAVETGLVEAVLVIGRDPDRPWIPMPKFATTAEEIIECAQANYCITPNLQLLRDAPYARIGIVGLACQIQGINRMLNLDCPPELAEKIVFTIELACASNTSRSGTEHLIEGRLQLKLTNVTNMRYRNGEYPGQFTVWDQDDQEHSLPFHELVTEFKPFKTFRCLACPDWWSGLADISVADGDPNIFRTSRSGNETEGLSLVMTRTEMGESLMEDARRIDRLAYQRDEFIEDESLGLQRKRHRYASYAENFPDRVPAPPVHGAEVSAPLSDDDIISSLSQN